MTTPVAMIEAERAEADAWLDLVASAPAPLAHAIGLAAGRDDNGTWVRCAAIRTGLLNRRFAVPGERTAEQLAGTAHESTWLQLPEHRTDDIAALRERGWSSAPLAAWTKVSWPELARSAGADDPRVGPVEGGEATAWALVIGRAHGMPEASAAWTAALVGRPGWHALAWRDDAAIVAGAALFVGDGRGWLGLAGTLPEHRGRGAQGALLRARIELARTLGVASIASETGTPPVGERNPSLSNMFRCGLVEVGQRVNLVAR